jgi:ketopantoate reductase
MLARAGHQVTLVARPQHVEAIRRDGLRMETKMFDEHVRLQADTEPQAVRDAEVVLFCVKSMDTEATGRQIAPFLAPEAGVPTEVSGDVRGALWLKLLLNCAYNAISAIAQLPYGPVAQGPGIPEVIQDLVDECLAVAKAEGVQVPGDVGAARGIPTPVNRTLWALVKLIESKQPAPTAG